MTITLEISSETEERLQRRADLIGKPLPEYVAELVERASQTTLPATLPLPPTPLAHLTPAEQNAAIDRLIANSPAAPSLPDSAFDRGEIYR
jgi:hypothetical protein